MTVSFLVHVERVESGRLVWWAEAPLVAGLSVAGDTLAHLTLLAREAAELAIGPGAVIALRLVEEGPSTTADDDTIADTVAKKADSFGDEFGRRAPTDFVTA